MSKIKLQSRNAVAETLLIPLYARALEAQQPAPLIRDDTAVALVERIDYDFARSKLSRLDQVTAIMRVREFDRRTRDFLGRHPEAAVVHIGCGLDTRFERVDNGEVTWYDLDLPEVIALRRQLIAGGDRRRYLGCSVFDSSWLADVSIHAGRPTLFLAEGVFPYFEEWFYFERPEPRLGSMQMMRHIPAIRKASGIFHYRLGLDGAPLSPVKANAHLSLPAWRDSRESKPIGGIQWQTDACSWPAWRPVRWVGFWWDG